MVHFDKPQTFTALILSCYYAIYKKDNLNSKPTSNMSQINEENFNNAKKSTEKQYQVALRILKKPHFDLIKKRKKIPHFAAFQHKNAE